MNYAVALWGKISNKMHHFFVVVVASAVTQVDQRLMDLQIFPQTTIYTQSNVQLGANEAGQSHSQRCTSLFS